jgi:anthranilate phosphoribosyltransferase
MQHAGPVRRALGVPTIFNLLGPLTNPARVPRQVMGVFDPSRVHDLARALGFLGSERVFVVHGFRRGVSAAIDAPPGIDDLSPEGESLLVEWHAGELLEHVVRPGDAGLPEHGLDALAGGDPHDNAAALVDLLEGHGEPAYRDAVAFGGALALLVAGEAPISALPDLAARVLAVLESGGAKSVLDRLVELSRQR